MYSRDSGFQLRSGRSAKVFLDGDREGEWETAEANRFSDDFDTWASERDETVTKLVDTAKYGTYYDQDLYGAEELNDNGSWDYSPDYGYIWQPHASAINAYHDWSPYRYGSWRWVPPFGWTWVNDEPWGWATYHHGRWIWYRNRWVWTPYGYHRGNRSWWRPALVVIQVVSRNVCWYPLGYRNRYYRYNRQHHDWIGNRDRRRNDDPRGQRPQRPRGQEPSNRTPGDRNVVLNRRRSIDGEIVPLGGVVTVPTDTFGTRRRNGSTAPIDIARAVLRTNLESDLPAPALPDPRTLRTRRDRDFITRQPQVVTSAPGPTRTGAGQRQRGVALDGELRRTRVLGDWPQLPSTTSTQSQPGGQNVPRRTGAVGRPTVPKPDSEGPPIYRPRTDLPTVSSPPANPQPRHASPRPEIPQRRDGNPEPDQPPRRRQESPRSVPPMRNDSPSPRPEPRTSPPPQRTPPPPPRQSPPAQRPSRPQSAPTKSDAPRVEAPKRPPLGGKKQAPID